MYAEERQTVILTLQARIKGLERTRDHVLDEKDYMRYRHYQGVIIGIYTALAEISLLD